MISTKEPENDITQSMYDRLGATVNDRIYPITTPLEVETFGTKAIAIKSDLTWYDLQVLQKEFVFVSFIDGMIVVSDGQ